jgi:hypothetical protein
MNDAATDTALCHRSILQVRDSDFPINSEMTFNQVIAALHFLLPVSIQMGSSSTHSEGKGMCQGSWSRSRCKGQFFLFARTIRTTTLLSLDLVRLA